MELLLGCGNRRDKRLTDEGLGIPVIWEELVTLDMNPKTGADVVHDLNDLPYPFDDGTFDEIHAYDVLEHCGRQGDWRFFFDQFAEIWRILKPDGVFCAICPVWNSVWTWGDPGHTRVISEGSIAFLSQSHTAKQIGTTSMTDYRFYWKRDFEVLATSKKGHNFAFVLRKAQ